MPKFIVTLPTTLYQEVEADNADQALHKAASWPDAWKVSDTDYKDIREMDTEVVMELSPESVRTYLTNGGSVCPFCGSHSITGDHVEIDSGTASQEVYCDECGGRWYDTYTLTGVGTY